MSLATVRAGVVAWLQAPNVTGLAKVYEATPKIITGGETSTGAGTGVQCFAVVAVTPTKRTRITTGLGGWKRNDYDVRLEVKLTSMQGTVDQAQDALDAVVQNIIARISSDPTLGGTVWQAGERPNGIEFTQGRPQLVGDVVNLWADVSFQATDWDQL